MMLFHIQYKHCLSKCKLFQTSIGPHSYGKKYHMASVTSTINLTFLKKYEKYIRHFELLGE
jgi:hypothetical protein